MLRKILAGVGVRALTTLRHAHDPESGGPVIDLTGDDSGLLIGRRGETLRALQFLVNLVVNNRLPDQNVRVVLDIERYRERRYTSLHELALRVAEKVAATGTAIPLEPMPANERRIVHLALSDHPRVSTESSGMGDTRRVTIAPRMSQSA